MKYYALLILGLLVALCVFSCSGEDKPDHDSTPPVNPTLIPHLGDVGDPGTDYYHLPDLVRITEENNGIDTVPDDDWIRISWLPFIDTDLSHVKIYRFDEFNPTPVLLDSIPSNNDEFLDNSPDLHERTIYSYYIDLVDTSGNTATSDTVSYALLTKCIPTSPQNNATVVPGQIVFSWDINDIVSYCRLLVLDENYEYVWHQDWVPAFPEDVPEIIFPVNLAQQHAGHSLRWRVDAFDRSEDLQGFMGSESNERIMHIQAK